MNSDRQPQRRLPAVDRILNRPDVAALASKHGRNAVTAWVRQAIAALRTQAHDLPSDVEEVASLVAQRVAQAAKSATAQRMRKVINGTGIVLHTNLGRAPLAKAAVEAMVEAAACTNLEVDLTTGLRGRRGAVVESLCQEVTGAEAALVVNNCAAATLLTLQTLAAGRRVVISRGQLIEIGGSFRLPDVFRQAGVELHEVGTTNRTRLSDYANAVGPQTAALLRVHPSNYRIAGFSESASTAELATLAKAKQLPLIDDVGSGCLYDLTRFGLPDEPIVPDSLRAGADLVLFSGDKLLGGPQCGVIVGRAELVAKLRSNPLARALRVDKLTLAALQATLEIHRAGRAFDELPVLRQLSMPTDEIERRTTRVLESLRSRANSQNLFDMRPVSSASGGGALPEQSLPSWAIAVTVSNPDEISRRLRMGNPSVFARVQEGCTLVDLRTVLPHDEEELCRRIVESTTQDAGEAQAASREGSDH